MRLRIHNIFIVYMAPGNYEQMVHYEDTIKNKVSQERILKYLDRDLQNKLRSVFGNKPIAVWGSRDSSVNRAHFEKMVPGDDILIVEGSTIKLLGKVAAKTINHDLSRELWQNLRGGNSTQVWGLIYFIANPLEIGLPFKKFTKLFGYRENWSLRGFTSVADHKLEEFYEQYDDLYSILLRIKQGKDYEQKRDTGEAEVRETTVELQQAEVEEILKNGELSDHLKIQYELILLGLKAGAKVWIPRTDQHKIQKEYNFTEFETTFTAGIDMPAKYVENIDVVWKEEFRIDAAFEIEHTTAIYSGLLRFSDLKIIAPNISYPLFIVAPTAKKNRVFEQMKRPVFKKLGLDREVHYLSYETVDEVSKFFENSTSGLNVELLKGKSETIK